MSRDDFNYVWRIRPVSGKLVRRVGWWLKTAPPGKTIRASSRRHRIGTWLLSVTDDRAFTVGSMTRAQRFWRKRLGREQREYVLVEAGDGE